MRDPVGKFRDETNSSGSSPSSEDGSPHLLIDVNGSPYGSPVSGPITGYNGDSPNRANVAAAAGSRERLLHPDEADAGSEESFDVGKLEKGIRGPAALELPPVASGALSFIPRAKAGGSPDPIDMTHFGKDPDASSVGFEISVMSELTLQGKVKNLLKASFKAFSSALLFSSAAQFWVANSFGVYAFSVGDRDTKEKYIFYGSLASLILLLSSAAYDTYSRWRGRSSKIFAFNAAAMGAALGSFLMRTVIEKANLTENERNQNLQLILTTIAAVIPALLRFTLYTPQEFQPRTKGAIISAGEHSCKRMIENVLDNRVFMVPFAASKGASAGLIAWRLAASSFMHEDFHLWTPARVACGVVPAVLGGAARFFRDSHPRSSYQWGQFETLVSYAAIMTIGLGGYFFGFDNMASPPGFEVIVYFLLAFSVCCSGALIADIKHQGAEEATQNRVRTLAA